jgi:hypothetical protein
MVAKNGASQEEKDDVGIGRHSKWTRTERGCYGQALREGRVRRPPPNAPSIANVFLWVFNIVGWLLLVTFMAWRIYISYTA